MHKLLSRVLLVFLPVVLMIGLASAQQAPQLTKLNGFLFEKLGSIGTRSEGPVYFLQLRNYKEITIKKHAALWQPDQTLAKFLNHNVQIEGYYVNDITIDYQDLKAWNPFGSN